jgi:hypothetical protein
MTHGLDVTTSFKGGLVEQTLFEISSGRAQEVTRWVMNTREHAIREALIAMGWTPPPEPSA